MHKSNQANSHTHVYKYEERERDSWRENKTNADMFAEFYIQEGLHSFIYIAPLQENYSEALPTPARLKSTNTRTHTCTHIRNLCTYTNIPYVHACIHTNIHTYNHRCKKRFLCFFIIFIKKRIFKVILFLEHFL